MDDQEGNTDAGRRPLFTESHVEERLQEAPRWHRQNDKRP